MASAGLPGGERTSASSFEARGDGIDRELPLTRFRRGRPVALVDRFLSLLQLRRELRWG
jgi:hypothetical protein